MVYLAAPGGQESHKCPSPVCQVSLEFSGPSTVPGRRVGLQIKADPNALCGLSAVDRSVFIKEPQRILNADNVTDSHNLPNTDSSLSIDTFKLFLSDIQPVACQETHVLHGPRPQPVSACEAEKVHFADT